MENNIIIQLRKAAAMLESFTESFQAELTLDDIHIQEINEYCKQNRINGDPFKSGDRIFDFIVKEKN